MSSRSLTAEQILTILRETPQRIAALTADLTPAQLHAAPAQGEWSANDVLAHLRACADVWGNCMATIIAEDAPAYAAVSPRTTIKETDYTEQQFQLSLHAFTMQRAELLRVLEGLAAEDWSRAATVTAPAGRVFAYSVHYYARRLARHERGHLKQFEQIVHTVHG